MNAASKAAQERYNAQQAAKSLPERENYSAKQAAMRLATDARTFRKFLRSSHCSFGAVGQGKRYEFTHEELMTLRDEFIEWREYSEARRTTNPIAPPTRGVPKPKAEPKPDQVWTVTEEELIIEEVADEGEPTEAELMDIEQLMGEWEDEDLQN
jgi:hypothetical protein